MLSFSSVNLVLWDLHSNLHWFRVSICIFWCSAIVLLKVSKVSISVILEVERVETWETAFGVVGAIAQHKQTQIRLLPNESGCNQSCSDACGVQK